MRIKSIQLSFKYYFLGTYHIKPFRNTQPLKLNTATYANLTFFIIICLFYIFPEQNKLHIIFYVTTNNLK